MQFHLLILIYILFSNYAAGVDDKFKISYTNNGETSNPLPAPTHDIQIITMTNYGKEEKPAPPPPDAAPSKGHLTNSSCLTGSSCNIIITTVVEHKPSLHPPPPPETGGGEHYLSPKAYVASA